VCVLLSVFGVKSDRLLGINLEGRKECLGLWLSENESSKFWLGVLNDIHARGVKDILITSVDG